MKRFGYLVVMTLLTSACLGEGYDATMTWVDGSAIAPMDAGVSDEGAADSGIVVLDALFTPDSGVGEPDATKPEPGCGNGICEDNEDDESCPQDCSDPVLDCLNEKCTDSLFACISDDGCFAMLNCLDGCEGDDCFSTSNISLK